MGPTHEKGGKEHAMRCHHSLETYLQDYIEAAGLASDREGVLFRTSYRRTEFYGPRDDAVRRLAMLQRARRDAGIPTAVCITPSAPPASRLSRQRLARNAQAMALTKSAHHQTLRSHG